jgi:tetratricopeptide (TPR) repeat protein
MRRITTVFLVYVALGSLLLVVARFLLPLMGMDGIDGRLAQPLVKLAPIALAIFLAAVGFIVLDLKGKDKRAVKQATRLVDEAENWSEYFMIGADDGGRYAEERPMNGKSVDYLEEISAGDDFSVARPCEHPAEPAGAPGTDDRRVENLPGHFPKKELNDLMITSSPEAAPENPKYARLRVTAETGRGFAVGHAEFAPGEASDQSGDFAQFRHVAGTSISPADVLHQLPPPLPEFAGRSFELAELYAARANRDVRVLGIQGPGGIGKTSLALKLADQLAPHYPDAQFYIDLKGESPLPMPVAEAQSLVVRAWLPTVRLPENETELNELYRSVLAGKRALLLLDNATSAQQVTPLIAPEGCLTIVTSRNYIGLNGMFAQQLEGLSPSEARELLRKMSPRIGDRDVRLAELCRHLPLALRLAASALVINPELKVDDYVHRFEQLRESGQSLSAVNATLSLSYDLLVPGLQKLWRMLSVFRDSFDVNAAAAVWRISPVRAANALDRLIAYNLVERNRATGRYRLHDLMAQLADSLSGDDERLAARQRHSAYYQGVLHEADALYQQGGAALKAGLELADREWPNIQAGQTWAAANIKTDRAACELCNSYPDAGRYVLDLRHHPRERIRWCEAAMAAARQLRRLKAAVRHLVTVGDSYADLAEIHHAIECYEQALEITRRADDSHGEADALSGLGSAYYLEGSLNRALHLHEEAMNIYANVGDRRGETNSLGSLGLAHYALGDLHSAAVLFDQHLKAAREIGDRRNESNALGGLGLSHYSMGDARQAAELFSRQLEITREIGDRRGEAVALNNLGNAYSALKFYRQAIAFQEQSLAVAREIGDRRNEAAALGGLGVAEYLEGNVPRSIELLERQLRLAVEIGDRRGEANAMANLGEVLVASGENKRAIEMLTTACNIHSQIGDAQGEANALFNLSLALDQAGERRKAIKHAEAALELFETADHPNAEIVINQLAEWGHR